jgi:hypothetical protein
LPDSGTFESEHKGWGDPSNGFHERHYTFQ